MTDAIGIVVIGRNEGRRLRTCLESIHPPSRAVVYVDSGSSDGSLQWAVSTGACGIGLDMSRPFTAGRARNTGFDVLLAGAPDVRFVQFLDGDCELDPGWLEEARAFLAAHPDHAVVCGRVRERHPDRSVFNRLCEWEWDAPAGETLACGGNALVRVDAFRQAGGFREQLIAGEEPELCLRLRRAGWRVCRLPAPMVVHDAAMTRFSQWWRRSTRAGHAFAEGAWLHGGGPERHWVRETLRPVVYAGILPAATLTLAILLHPAWLLLALVYPLQVLRLSRGQGGFTRAFYLVLGRFPEFLGVLQFVAARVLGGPRGIIEYK